MADYFEKWQWAKFHETWLTFRYVCSGTIAKEWNFKPSVGFHVPLVKEFLEKKVNLEFLGISGPRQEWNIACMHGQLEKFLFPPFLLLYWQSLWQYLSATWDILDQGFKIIQIGHMASHISCQDALAHSFPKNGSLQSVQSFQQRCTLNHLVAFCEVIALLDSVTAMFDESLSLSRHVKPIIKTIVTVVVGHSGDQDRELLDRGQL